MKKIKELNKLIEFTEKISEQTIIGLLKTKYVYTINLGELQDILQFSFNTIMNENPNFLSTGELCFPEFRRYDPYAQITHLEWYKNTPILIYNMARIDSSPESTSTWTTLYMSTINTKRNVKNCKEFLRKLYNKSVKESMNDWVNTVYYHNGRFFDNKQKYQRKTFDDVFISSNIKDSIRNTIDQFKSQRKWYFDHGIPYHFGFILFGQSGSGKTSLAEAIATYANAREFVISGDNVFDLPTYFNSQIRMVSPRQLQCIIIEDIDVGLINPNTRFYNPNYHEDEYKNKRPNGMAQLLNSLDGVNAPQDTIYVFTTNHIEKLDNALIRPGRIDMKINVEKISSDALSQFAKKFYNKTIDTSIINDNEIPDDLTFAELQTKVMSGMSFDELLSYIKGRKENGSIEM